MVQHILLLEVLRILPGASEQGRHIIVSEGADFVVLVFDDGDRVELLGVLGGVFDRVRGELQDICEADFAFGGGHGEKGEDGFVPFPVDPHDGTVGRVQVDGSHHVSNVAALLEETEGLAELRWSIGRQHGSQLKYVWRALRMRSMYRQSPNGIESIVIKPLGHVDGLASLHKVLHLGEGILQHAIDLILDVEQRAEGVGRVDLFAPESVMFDVFRNERVGLAGWQAPGIVSSRLPPRQSRCINTERIAEHTFRS